MYNQIMSGAKGKTFRQTAVTLSALSFFAKDLSAPRSDPQCNILI